LNIVYPTLVQKEWVRKITRGKDESGEVMVLTIQTAGKGVRG